MIYFDATSEAAKRTSAAISFSSPYSMVVQWRYRDAIPGASFYRTIFAAIDDVVSFNGVDIFQEDTGKIVFSIVTGGVVVLGGSFTTAVAAVVDRIYLIGYTRSGNTHRFYLDGALVFTFTFDLTGFTAGEVWIGDDSYFDWNDHQFQYFREFDSTLSLDALNAQWQAQVSPIAAWADYPLVANGNDISGNGRNLTLVGSPSFPTEPYRIYPTLKSPYARVEGALQGTWDSRGWFSPVRRTNLARATKIQAGALATVNFETNQQGDFDMCFGRWMTVPLEAQTISGTFDCCFYIDARFVNGASQTADSVVRTHLHIYITQGVSTAVRHTLLNDYVDAADWPTMLGGGIIDAKWKQLFAPAALTSGDAEAGDCIMIEIGARVVSSPTPTPTYPPSAWTLMPWRGTGVNNTTGAFFTDAFDGQTSLSLAPWFQFSLPIIERTAADPPPPANDACADAIEISAFPYASSDVVSFNSTDTDRAVWWTFEAPESGLINFTAAGTNYGAQIRLYTGACGALSLVASEQSLTPFTAGRSQALATFIVTAGTRYHVAIVSTGFASSTASPPNTGGIARLTANYWSDPAEDDLYIPSGTQIRSFREGVFNVGTSFGSTVAVTGVGFDYTRRPMVDLEDASTNESERILVGDHNSTIVEILDLPTLSLGRTEVDYIANPFGAGAHVAQLALGRVSGELYVGFFGNGYLYVDGEGALPAVLNTVSNAAACSDLRQLSADAGDNQPGAPFAATTATPALDVTAAWGIALDEENGILYYISGGVYVPVGGQTIKRWQIGVGQLADFATLTADPDTPNPGLKGMEFIPGGGLLVCNGSTVVRLDAAGTPVQTYTPTPHEDALSLADVVLSADGTRFWTIDLWSTRVFEFNLATGVQISDFQPYTVTGTLIQMGVYQPNGIIPPSPPGTATLVVRKVTLPSGVAQVFGFLTPGLVPPAFTLVDGGSQAFAGIAAGTYAVSEALPEGWQLASVVVSNADPPEAITLSNGDAVTVTFTNVLTSSIGPTPLPANGCPAPDPGLPLAQDACPAPDPT